MRRPLCGLVAGMVLSVGFTVRYAPPSDAAPPTLECHVRDFPLNVTPNWCVEDVDRKRELFGFFWNNPALRRAREERTIAELKGKDGKPIFADEQFNRSLQAYRNAKGTLAFAEEALGYTDASGKERFNAWDIIELWKVQQKGEEAFQHLDEFMVLGFDARTYVSYRRGGGTFAEAQQWCERGYAPTEIARSKWLGILPFDCTPVDDPQRPNAVIIYAASDWNHAFDSTLEREHFEQIRKTYDTFVRIAEDEKQVYATLDTVPNIALFNPNGHGSRTALTLSEGSDSAAATERYRIDITDRDELQEHFSNLTPTAVIFLRSCSTAEGGELADNLANIVAVAAPGHTVYAAREPFSTDEFTITSTMPFSVQITADSEGRSGDITYCVTRTGNE